MDPKRGSFSYGYGVETSRVISLERIVLVAEKSLGVASVSVVAVSAAAVEMRLNFRAVERVLCRDKKKKKRKKTGYSNHCRQGNTRNELWAMELCFECTLLCSQKTEQSASCTRIGSGCNYAFDLIGQKHEVTTKRRSRVLPVQRRTRSIDRKVSTRRSFDYSMFTLHASAIQVIDELFLNQPPVWRSIDYELTGSNGKWCIMACKLGCY